MAELGATLRKRMPTRAAAPRPRVRAQKQPLVWLLTGSRPGDNNQLLALAEALGWPFEIKRIKYNQLRRVPALRKGLVSVAPDSRGQIRPPWPDLLITVGYAGVGVARHIRELSGGRTKLVHIGNPRTALDDFDLQITTPQYSRGPAPNLLELPLPIGNPARTARSTIDELRWLRDFPRPRRLVAVGGPARHWELDHKALASAISDIRDKQPEGSLIVVTSNRTRTQTRRLLSRLVSGDRAALVDSFPSFPTLLAQCDEIYVTADSVSMLSEAVLTGKPTGMIPIKRSLRGILSHALWEMPRGKALFPDFNNFWAMLRRNRLIGNVCSPVGAEVGDTVDRAADAVRALFAHRKSSPTRIWVLLGAHAGDNDQLIATAEGIGLPFEIKQLKYNRFRHLGPRLLGRSLLSLTDASRRAILSERAPDLTISAGHRSVAAVQALRHRSKGRTRAIHVGFPRVSAQHFDLVISTPQYPMADDPHLLRVPFAFTRAATAPQDSVEAEELLHLPYPRRLLVIGGPTAFYDIDPSQVLGALSAMLDEATDGGSIIVTTSPRTPQAISDAVSTLLAESPVPSLLAEPGKPPPYTSLLAGADSIRITADSVSMISDAIWTGKPLALVPVAINKLGRVANAVRNRLFPGKLLYPHDLGFFWDSLAKVGITESLSVPKTSTSQEMRAIFDRIRPILDSSDEVRSPLRRKTLGKN